MEKYDIGVFKIQYSVCTLTANSLFGRLKRRYSGETHKADKRAFKKKPHGTYCFSKKPFSSVKFFIQDKWYASGINKI